MPRGNKKGGGRKEVGRKEVGRKEVGRKGGGRKEVKIDMEFFNFVHQMMGKYNDGPYSYKVIDEITRRYGITIEEAREKIRKLNEIDYETGTRYEDLIPTEAPIDSIPTEMKNRIYDFLDLEGLVNTGLTSKSNMIIIGTEARIFYNNLLKRRQRGLIEGKFLVWSKTKPLFNFRVLLQINACVKQRRGSIEKDTICDLIDFLLINEYYDLLQSILVRIFMPIELSLIEFDPKYASSTSLESLSSREKSQFRKKEKQKILSQLEEEKRRLEEEKRRLEEEMTAFREIIFYQGPWKDLSQDHVPIPFLFIERGLIKFLELFLDNGLDVNHRFPDYKAAETYPLLRGVDSYSFLSVDNLFHAALEMNNLEMVRFLVERGANINPFEGEFKTTSLLIACEKNNYELVEYILDLGVDPNEKGNLRWQEAVKSDSWHDQSLNYIFKEYSTYGKNIDPLFFVVLSSRIFDDDEKYYYDLDTQIDILTLLLERGANPEESSQDDRIKLMSCTERMNEEMLEILKEYGAVEEEESELCDQMFEEIFDLSTEFKPDD